MTAWQYDATIVVKVGNRWQALEVDAAGKPVRGCGHDDHKTRRDAAQCVGRFAS